MEKPAKKPDNRPQLLFHPASILPGSRISQMPTEAAATTARAKTSRWARIMTQENRATKRG